ncbi:DUF1850 domain-containing protein [Paenibacillus sp.]|uniref:DUF1850 domain-containing protein n=1 Tax=Paenibacillus sp. TaxID=58172 RepID=UPI002D66BD64|nr:DUF1850 domain-containing protein [Paenibacillus sp.]HZG85323.1 DUF1850 domain-containing protein [Paenibacillus sp.]
MLDSMRQRRFRLAALLLTGASLACLLLFWPFTLSLTVTEEETNELALAVSVRPGDTFGIRFIHSVHRTPVEETYRIDANSVMVLERVVYETYGVGNPSGAEPGQRFRIEDGKLIVESFGRTFDVIRLRIGQKVANHELIADGVSVPLANVSEPGSRVRIEIKKLSVWRLLHATERR